MTETDPDALCKRALLQASKAAKQFGSCVDRCTEGWGDLDHQAEYAQAVQAAHDCIHQLHRAAIRSRQKGSNPSDRASKFAEFMNRKTGPEPQRVVVEPSKEPKGLFQSLKEPLRVSQPRLPRQKISEQVRAGMREDRQNVAHQKLREGLVRTGLAHVDLDGGADEERAQSSNSSPAKYSPSRHSPSNSPAKYSPSRHSPSNSPARKSRCGSPAPIGPLDDHSLWLVREARDSLKAGLVHTQLGAVSADTRDQIKAGLVRTQLNMHVSEDTQQSIKSGLVKTQLEDRVSHKAQQSIRARLRDVATERPNVGRIDKLEACLQDAVFGADEPQDSLIDQLARRTLALQYREAACFNRVERVLVGMGEELGELRRE